MNNLEKIFGALRGVVLTVRERNNMRLQLQVHMREHPLRSSWQERTTDALAAFPSRVANALNSPVFLTHPAFAACILVLCIGVTTSYAAESALPGQALYSFKTRVNEPIQGALALTPEAKAEWSAELTNRRLQEAEELAATNKLSPVATADIERGLNAAMTNFSSNVALLAKNDDVQAANAQTDLEASLNAHEVVLATLPTKQKNNATRITSLIQKHADTIDTDQNNVEASFTATDSPAVKNAALNQLKWAQDAVDQTQKITKDASDTQVASSVSDITRSAKGDIDAGNSDAKHGKWGKAFGAFQDAIRKMKETQDSINTRNWLKTKFNIGVSDTATTSTSTIQTTQSSSTTATDTQSSPDDSSSSDSSD